MKIDKKELFEQYKQDLLNNKYLQLEIIVPKFNEDKGVIPYCHVNSAFGDNDGPSEFEYAILYDLLNTIKSDIEERYPDINFIVDTFNNSIDEKIEIEDEDDEEE